MTSRPPTRPRQVRVQVNTEGGGRLRLAMVLLLLWSAYANAHPTSGSESSREIPKKDKTVTGVERGDKHPTSLCEGSLHCSHAERATENSDHKKSQASNGSFNTDLSGDTEDKPRALLLSEENPPQFAVPIYGYLCPAIGVLTVVSNSLLCFVLLKKEMRSPTNALLVAVAISDMLTGLFPVPFSIYLYASDRFWEYVPFEWCWPFVHLALTVPVMFHTASLWLITALGIQRYICVCHPLKARIWCTMKKTLRLIGIIFVMAFLNHVYRFIKFDYVAVELPSAVDANKTVVGCVRVSHVQDNETLQILENVYNFHYSVNIQFIPCVVLLVVNVLLIRTKRQAEKRRVELLRQNRRRESRMMRESTSSTLMLVIVVSLFLVLEIPIGLSQLFRSVSYPFGFTRENTSGAVVFFHLFFFLNNPCIFVVYCTMSKKFRNTLKHLLTPSCHRCTRPATEDGHNVEVIQLDIAGH